MDKKYFRELLRHCDEGNLSDMLNMILIRWHELQPQWEHFVFAVPLKAAEERKRTAQQLSRELSQPRPDIEWDEKRMWMFFCTGNE